VDERLDPYSARSAAGLYRRAGRTERLASLLRNERVVENIIRERSWSVIQDRCAGGLESRWEDALDKWREGKGEGLTRGRGKKEGDG
jgi:Caffeine-induced death protein 2